MNQKQLYERQLGTGTITQAPAASLGQREMALLQWILENTGAALNKSEIRIAELSVGDGQLSRALARTFHAAMIDCIDISPRRLEHCRQMAGEVSPSIVDRMRFLELNLDIEFAHLERNGYDIVIAIDVLEHVFDPFHFVRNCREILKPGGHLFLRVPNIAYFKRRFAILCGQLPITSSWFDTPGSFRSWKERHGWDGGHLHFFTIDALAWLLADEGFQCLSYKDVGATGEAIRRIWPSMLFGNVAVFARKLSKLSNALAH